MSFPRALLVDLDGTLADTEELWEAAELALFAEAGVIAEPGDLAPLVGVDMERGARIIRDLTGLDCSTREINDFLVSRVSAGMLRGVPWRDGSIELLESMRSRGVPCLVVTSSPRELAEIAVTQLPPGTIAGIVAAEDVSAPKPHPEPYRLAARLAQCEPAECLAVEDSPTGVESALSSGAVTVAVPNMVAISATSRLSRLESLSDLTAAVIVTLMAGERVDQL